MPECTISRIAIDANDTYIRISSLYKERNCALCTGCEVRNINSCHFYPVFVSILQVVTTLEQELLWTVVASTGSLSEIELTIANHVLHACELDVVLAFGTILPCAMPIGRCIAINEDTEVATIIFITSLIIMAVGRRHLAGRGNQLCSDNVFSKCQGLENLSAELIVLGYQDIVVQNHLEVGNKLFCFILRNIFEEPFAGVKVRPFGPVVPCPSPEGHILFLTGVSTIVAPRRGSVIYRAVTILMEILLTISWILSESYADDVLVFADAIRFYVLRFAVSIVEYHITCLGFVGSSHEAAFRSGSDANVCIHTCILHQDAVAILALSEFPQEVGFTSIQCAVNNSVHVILIV